MFSFFLSKSPEENGSITFGGYDLAAYAKAGLSEKDIFWGEVSQNENYWTLGMDHAGLNSSEGQRDLGGVKAKYAIIDSGVSYAILPTEDFNIIKRALGDYGVKCSDPQGAHSSTATPTCECASFTQLPSIQMRLNHNARFREENGGQWFDLPPSSYMEKVGETGCGTLRLTPSNEKFGKGNPSDYWILGDIFLQNYYSIYDYPNSKMGLVEARPLGGNPKKNTEDYTPLPVPQED